MIYDEKITAKSFNEMLRFLRFTNSIDEVPLLFGGWAVYQFNPYAGSKDVDFVIDDSVFDRCIDFLVSSGYGLEELRLKKGEIFFDLYKKSEGISTAGASMDLKKLYRNAERVFLRSSSAEVLLPSLSDLFLSKVCALVSREVPKDKSDVIALLAKFSEGDFKLVRQELTPKMKSSLELLINKRDVFAFVMKPTSKSTENMNSRIKKLVK